LGKNMANKLLDSDLDHDSLDASTKNLFDHMKKII
jgi:hypothetical protein